MNNDDFNLWQPGRERMMAVGADEIEALISGSGIDWAGMKAVNECNEWTKPERNVN